MADAAAALTAGVAQVADAVRLLADELASFRRRALQAEARVRQFEEGIDPTMMDARVAALEEENAALRARLETATERTRQMLERVRFLRQQRDASEAR